MNIKLVIAAVLAVLLVAAASPHKPHSRHHRVNQWLNAHHSPEAHASRAHAASELGEAVLAAAAAPYNGSVDDGPACPFSLPFGEVPPTFLTAALAQVDALARSLLSTTTGPIGMHVNVVHGDNLLLSKGYGSRMVNFNLSSGPPVTGDTVFRLGSNSKPFTTLALHVLAEAGVVGLNDPLSKWLPEFQYQDDFAAGGPITLLQLATFQAGLQREGCTAAQGRYLCGIRLGDNFTAIYEAMKHSRTLFPRDSLTPIYSNLQVDLLGWALGSAVAKSSQHAQKGFHQLMRDILGDLGMTSSGFNVTEYIRGNFAWCMPPYCTQDLMFSDFGFSDPSAGMFASGYDMAAWLRFLVSAHNSSSPSPLQLSKATQRAFQRPVTMFSGGTSGYGYSSMVAYIDGDWVFTKGGAVTGYNSAILVVPELQLGISILTSSLGFDGSTFTVPALRVMKPAIIAGRTSVLEQMYAGVYVADALDITATVSVGPTSLINTVHIGGAKPQTVVQAMLPGAPNTFFVTAEASLSCFIQEALISSVTASAKIGGDIFDKDEIVFQMDAGVATSFVNSFLGVTFNKQK